MIFKFFKGKVNRLRKTEEEINSKTSHSGESQGMTWKQDRVFVFLDGGLNYNTDPSKRYYFDRSDNLFFRLKNQNGAISYYPVSPLKLSKGGRSLLDSKIEKVKAGSKDIFEIEPFAEKMMDPDRGKPAKNREDYERRFKFGVESAKKIADFLEQNKIDITLTDVIEY